MLPILLSYQWHFEGPVYFTDANQMEISQYEWSLAIFRNLYSKFGNITWVCLKIWYILNEIAIFHRDNDQTKPLGTMRYTTFSDTFTYLPILFAVLLHWLYHLTVNGLAPVASGCLPWWRQWYRLETLDDDRQKSHPGVDIYRKPWFLPLNIGVSYKFSLKPIQWLYQNPIFRQTHMNISNSFPTKMGRSLMIF